MKFPKTAVMLLLVFSVALISVLQIETVKAQDPLNITIKPDGSVVPDTDLLERNGNIYMLKGDVFGTITVQKNGVTIDGDGYTLQGRDDIDEKGVYLLGPELYLSCENVLVKNLKICNFSTGIFVPGANNNTIINNYLENSRIHLLGGADDGEGDLIKHNIFRDTGVFVDYNKSGLDVITENSFFNGWIAVGLSSVPVVEKNYWSDYNGTDRDGDGIGEAPHTSQYLLDETVQDKHPLMTPLDIEVIPEFPTSNVLALILVASLGVEVYRKRIKKIIVV